MADTENKSVESEETNEVGRPSKFNEAVREKILSLAEKGKTVDQIADIIGVSPRTIYNWQGRHKDLFHALREAKQVADDLVEASLFARAIGYSHPEQKVFCTKDGDIITHDMEKHYPPDPTAGIFWLKNRKPNEWRDKVEVKSEVDAKVKHSGGLSIDLQERVKQLKGEE